LHPVLKAKFTTAGFSVSEYEGKDINDFTKTLKQFDGLIIRSRFKITKEILEQNSKLKFIGRAGAGLENIDVAFAETLGIKCYNSPEGNRDAVGEHALGMLLALQNKMLWADAEVRKGIWRRNENWGEELKTQTLGIIGYGNMGSTFAKKLRGLEMDCIAYDKYKTGFSNDFVKEVSLDAIFEQADIVSFHVPLTPETKQMFNAAFIDKMKKPFVLINTARGQVVDTNALVEGMKSKSVKGAALDVLEYEQHTFENLFEKELPEAMEWLMQQQNVIFSPHIAGWTYQSYYKIADVLVEKILADFR
jgi:D-3-phosphoglycerate dehydrogenase